MLRTRISVVFILSLLMLPGARGLAQTFSLHDGDRVVFYGDSITAQRLYTRYVEDMVLTRYPKMRVEFWNAGVGGDTVKGGYTGDTATRLKRDLFPHNPTVVTVMLGMNDGGWGTFHQDWFEGFLAGYHSLLSAIDTRLPGARITVIKPTPYDEITHGTEFPGYSAVVARYADGVVTIGNEPHRTFADFYGPVTNLLSAGKRNDPSLAELLVPDRIHPGEATHWVMAAALVRAWGMTPLVSSVGLDAVSGKSLETRNASVTGMEVTASGLRWTQVDGALPLPLPLNDPLMQFVLKSSGIASMDQQMLRVQGLPAAHYTLKIDAKRIASFTRDELATGVNLALYPTPMEQQAREVDGSEQQRARLDETRFMLTDESLHVAGSNDAAKTIALADAASASEQREKAQPKPHAFELVVE